MACGPYRLATLTRAPHPLKIMAMRSFGWVVAAAAIIISPSWAQTNACDVNSDGVVDLADVQLAINMALGVTRCTANVYGAAKCNAVVVQRITNVVLGSSCRTDTTA